MMRVNHMTLDQFFQQHELYVQGLREELGTHYVQKAKAQLVKKPFGFREETALKVARGVVLNGDTLQANAESSDDDDDDETELINAIHQDYSRYTKISLLCIQAPTDKVGKPLEIDEKARDMQFENFVKLHPMLKQERPNMSTVVRKVYNFEATKKEMEGFIAKEGTSAFIAAVMFNGHGSEKGLVFHEHGKGDEIPLDSFIEHFRKVIDKYRSAENFNLPRKVEVIFGQCYAHENTDPNIPSFTIYSFTNDKEEKTYVCDRKDAMSQDVTDSHHYQLEEYAQNQEALWKRPTTMAAALGIEEEPCTSVGIEEEEGMEVEAAL